MTGTTEQHRYVLFPDPYDIHTATAAACSCGAPGCVLFPTGEDTGPWMRENARVSVVELRWRARRLDRAHAQYARRAATTKKEGVLGFLHVGGGKDAGSYRGTWSSLEGLAQHTKSKRLLVDEELRRRGARPVPPDSGRWWHALVPTTDALLWVTLGVITGTVAGWVFIGVLYLAVGVTSGDWSFDAELLRVWAATVAVSVAASLRNLVDD